MGAAGSVNDTSGEPGYESKYESVEAAKAAGVPQADIDAYLARLAEDVIGALTEDEFKTARSALVTRYREPDRTLAEACERRWSPIANETHDWARRERLADAVALVSPQEVRDLAVELPTRPRVAVHCFGAGAHLEAFGEDDGAGSVEIGSWDKWRSAQATWPSLEAEPAAVGAA